MFRRGVWFGMFFLFASFGCLEKEENLEPGYGRISGTVGVQSDMYPPPAGDLAGTLYVGILSGPPELGFGPVEVASWDVDFNSGVVSYQLDLPEGEYLVAALLDDNENFDPQQMLPDAEDLWNPLTIPAKIVAGKNLRLDLLLDTPGQPAKPFCGEGALTPDNYQCVFDFIWNLADFHFPFFELNNIDWSSIKIEYAQRLSEISSNAEFVLLMTELVAELKDAHSQMGMNSWAPLLGITGVVLDIGLTFLNDQVFVERVKPGSPADLAGLQIGDLIVEVDGQTIQDREAEIGKYLPRPNLPYYQQKLLTLWMAGAVGSSAQVQIERDGLLLSLPRSLPLGQIDSVLLSKRVTGSSGKAYGYIRIGSFSESHPEVVEKFWQALDELLDVDGMILDVRDNSGGLATFAASMISRLLDQPVEIERNYFRGDSQNYVTTTVNPAQNPYLGPLVVLIDENSYSEGHMFPSELKAIGRATLVGRTTGGGNGTPEFWPLLDNLEFSVSTKFCTTGSGGAGEEAGTQPDVWITKTKQDIQAGLYSDLGNPAQDVVLAKALEELGN